MNKQKKFLSETDIYVYSQNDDLTKRWYITYKFRGKIHRIWINSASTVQARKNQIEKIKLTILSGEKFARPKRQPIELEITTPASKRFVELLNGKVHLRKKTKATYKSKIKIFNEWCHDQGITVIDEACAESFLKYLQTSGRSVCTVNAYRNSLKGFCRALSSSRNLKSKAFDKTKKLRGNAGGGREYYRPGQKEKIKLFFGDNYPHLWFACKFVYFCFVRNGNELIHLKVSDVDLYLKKLSICAETAKNGFAEIVRIPKVFADELEKMNLQQYDQNYYLLGKDGKPGTEKVSRDYWGKLHLKALTEMNFDKGGKKYSMYSWKNTGAVDLHNSGFPIRKIQDQLRHKNLETTYKYLRCLGLFDDDDTFDAVKPL